MVTASTEHDFLAGRRGANSPRGIGTILDFRALLLHCHLSICDPMNFDATMALLL